jgi:stage III sporulation protein SpoIIIAA
MRHLRLNVPKVRDKLRRFVEISSAGKRWTVMIVHVDVKHPDFIVVGELQSLADCARAHHRSNRFVVDVVTICHGMVVMRQDY